MTAGTARELVRQWVRRHATGPGFEGAFFHGSINDLSDDAVLGPSSDVDLIVCSPNGKSGKLRSGVILLDVTYRPLNEFLDPEVVLGQHQIAPSFKSPCILSDPTGGLTLTNQRIMRDFAKREWVERRVESALEKIKSGRLDPNASFPNQVLSWLFPTGITTHVLLVAGLRNPTVRRRYLAVRDLLSQYRRLYVYPDLLAHLGCKDMTRAQAQAHLDRLEKAFDATAGAIQSPFPYAADLTPEAKPVAIQGSQELIDQGNHKEAVFWLVATFARCQQVLGTDAPRLAPQFDASFRVLLADLGIQTSDDLQRRRDANLSYLGDVERTARTIMDMNSSVKE